MNPTCTQYGPLFLRVDYVFNASKYLQQWSMQQKLKFAVTYYHLLPGLCSAVKWHL